MSVVGSDYESLKRFNLAEIYGKPTPKLKAEASQEADGKIEAKGETMPDVVETNEVQE